MRWFIKNSRRYGLCDFANDLIIILKQSLQQTVDIYLCLLLDWPSCKHALKFPFKCISLQKATNERIHSHIV